MGLTRCADSVDCTHASTKGCEQNKKTGRMMMNAAALEGFRMIADQMLGTPVVTAEELDAKMQQKFADLDAKLAKLKAMMAEG